jgi:hypothetical protein
MPRGNNNNSNNNNNEGVIYMDNNNNDEIERKIILISGLSRSGKDTVADMLAARFDNSKRLAFASPMKAILAETLGLTLEQLEERKNSSQYAHRGYLQRFGQVCKRYFGENCWGEIVEHTIDNLPKDSIIIISDFRMPVEHIEGAITVQVVNPRVTGNDPHVSENALKDFKSDAVIVNDGTLEELEDKVQDLVNRLEASGWTL